MYKKYFLQNVWMSYSGFLKNKLYALLNSHKSDIYSALHMY